MNTGKILIINSAEPGVRDYTEPLILRVKENALDSELLEWRDLLKGLDLSLYLAVIISASPMGDNANFEERVEAFRWLKDCRIPVLGICAGHQFIGSIFGAGLIKDRESELGELSVTILEEDPLFSDLPREIKVYQQHHDSVSLPPDFRLLAGSERCRVQAMVHRERPIYGLQWHAELSSAKCISNFIRLGSLDVHL